MLLPSFAVATGVSFSTSKPWDCSGKAAKAIYEKLSVPATGESGWLVKTTPGGSVTCYDYPDYYQCSFSGLTDMQAR